MLDPPLNDPAHMNASTTNLAASVTQRCKHSVNATECPDVGARQPAHIMLVKMCTPVIEQAGIWRHRRKNSPFKLASTRYGMILQRASIITAPIASVHRRRSDTCMHPRHIEVPHSFYTSRTALNRHRRTDGRRSLYIAMMRIWQLRQLLTLLPHPMPTDNRLAILGASIHTRWGSIERRLRADQTRDTHRFECVTVPQRRPLSPSGDSDFLARRQARGCVHSVCLYFARLLRIAVRR